MRKRVLAYVTRERDGKPELLVFDHRDRPQSGTQVPAGRLDRGETLEQGLRRELHEEAGLDRIRIVRELEGLAPHYPQRYENHAFLVEVEGEAPDTWTHEIFGDGNDAGEVLVYRWEPIGPDLLLWHVRDPLLEELEA